MSKVSIEIWWAKLPTTDKHRILWQVEEATALRFRAWGLLPQATKTKLAHYYRTRVKQ